MTSEDQIQAYINSFSDWRSDTLRQLYQQIKKASPDIKEEWKWDVPVFTQNGMVCAISAFKEHIKINSFKGASLRDPNKLINAGFTSKAHRSIDFKEGDAVPEEIGELISEAVENNKK